MYLSSSNVNIKTFIIKNPRYFDYLGFKEGRQKLFLIIFLSIFTYTKIKKKIIVIHLVYNYESILSSLTEKSIRTSEFYLSYTMNLMYLMQIHLIFLIRPSRILEVLFLKQ